MASTLMGLFFALPPLLLLAFVLILAVRARRGERGWTWPLRVLIALLVAWLVAVIAFVVVGLLTFDPRDL